MVGTGLGGDKRPIRPARSVTVWPGRVCDAPAWGTPTRMRDVVAAILIAVGLEVVFFVLLMVGGRLEPEQSEVQGGRFVPRRVEPSHAPTRDAADTDQQDREAA